MKKLVSINQSHVTNDYKLLSGKTPMQYFSECELYSDYFKYHMFYVFSICGICDMNQTIA
jgi:hypothetical protein